MSFNESMLTDLNMNYYTHNSMDPFSSVEWFKEENDWTHPWSIKSRGQMYGFHKLHDIMPIKDFMTMPWCILEDLIEGITIGRAEREKLDHPNPPQNPGDLRDNKDLLYVMKQMGLDKIKF